MRSRILQPLYVIAVSTASSSATLRSRGRLRYTTVSELLAFRVVYTDIHSLANRIESGGLSGVPLKPYTLATLRALRPLLPASVPIFGCGGISTGADALEYAREGCTAVQLYTSFGYDGVGAPRRIKDELAALLRAEGTTWSQVVGQAVQAKSWQEPPPPAPVRPGEATVEQLVAEAEELKRLLDEYASEGKRNLSGEETVVAAVA